jgi:sterol 3beta-glucosyltransferase
MVKKHNRQDNDFDDDFEDWTMIDDEEDVEVPASFEIPSTVAGMHQDASRTGGGSLALGSMVLKGVATSRRTSESAKRD